VTPDHDLYWHGRSHNRATHWRKATAADSMTKIDRHMKRTIAWTAPDVPYHLIPALQTPRKFFPELRLPMDDWLRFLGWYCSEGSLARNALGYTTTTISQQNVDNMDQIERIVQRLGFTPRRYPKDLKI
jgi:hypothetical protein